jgi:hypothetical protein
VADYNANIKVNADTRQAESQLKKLQNSLDKLSDISSKVNLQSAQQQFSKLGTALRGVGERGALGAITLGAGKATVAIGGLGAKMGVVGAAAASMGAAVNGALGGVPGVVTDILAQVGNIPNAFGLAAVAAMAFAPQVLKASSATVGLGAAIDKAVGTQTTQRIASVVDGIGQLNVELNATKATFADLVEGSTLNQLNNQLKDAVKESGAFHSSTEEAVVAAEQLVTVQKEQRREQKAITDLIRQAQGLQPKDVRDTEVARRVALLKSREIQHKKDLQLQNQINAELAEYERLAAEVANQTKQWANNLDRIARSSKAGVLGSQSQIQARLQEFRENRRSAEIARQRSAELAARERQLAGGQYSLGQVPARGELFPGGRTETAANQYRAMLNEQARIQQAAATALQRSEKTLIGLQAQTLRTEKDITAAKRQQQSLDERSVQLIREQNKLLLEQYRAEQRVSAGVLDPASLRADRMRRVEQGRAQQKRRRQMTENVIIGGAFPMLFGGGPGAVLGGAAGGFIPGNPMLSVATSALGAMVDQFATSTAEMGNALRNPIESFQELAEKGLLASKSQEKYIQKLIEAGRVYEASAIIQDEIIQKIGVQGYKDLQNAGAASEKLNKAFAELSIQMQAAVAGPLAAMLSWLANVIAIGNKTTASAAKQTDILQGLSAQDRAALQQQEQRILSGANIFNEAEKRQQVAQLYQSYSARANVQRPGVTVDSTAAQQAAAQTQQLQAQVDLSAKQLSLVGLTLEKDGERYVNAAKAVALQEYDNKLLEIKNSWIGKVFDAEKNLLMIRGANLAYAAQLRQIDSQVAQQREQNTTALLQAELALYKQAEQNLMFEIKRAQYVDNEKGGAQALLKYYSDIYTQRYNAFLVEREIALKEAERAGTTQDVVRLYQLKLSLLQAEAGLEQAIAKLTQDRLELEKKINAEKAITEARQPFVDFRRNLELQDQYNKTYLRLVTEGMLPAEAERIANFEQLVAQQLLLVEDQIKAINSQIILTEATITEAEARGAAVAKLREELDLLEKRKKAIEGEAQDSGKGEQPGDRIKSAIAAARGELNELVDLENQVIAGAAAIGDAFAQSFKGLVSGAMTGQEALAAFFKNVGDHFMDMASKMIAKLIEIYILETIVGFITGAAGGGASGGPATAPAFAPPAVAAQGAYWPGGFEAFANGGMVTRPTMGLVGEGGEPEYIIPASKMRGAMSRYSAGARGSSVIPGNGDQTGSENNGNAATMQPIDVRYSIERINNVDYVTADQFQRGMAQAAQQGAIQGERRAMRSLKNSASTRRSVGI